MRSILGQALSWLYTRFLFGERCSETMEGCPVCDKWAEHDDIFNR